MHSKQISPSKNRINKSEISHITNSSESFLSRYFHSREFAFPEFDQEILNSKINSIAKLVHNFDQQTQDFKSWILNNYIMSSYFKKIILEDKSVRIFNPSSSSNTKFKESNKNERSIYIGHTSANQKHGYGFEVNLKIIEPTQEDQQLNIQFFAYEGFYVNNLKHGKGKYFSNAVNSTHPNFYYGRFVNGEPCEQKTAFMCWTNNDFYIGKVKSNFIKEGMGVLFIAEKDHKSLQYDRLSMFQINIKKEPRYYEMVVISDWQQNTTKVQSLQSSSNFHTLQIQTKIICHSQYYFGEAYVYYSSKARSHICIKEGTGYLKYINGDVYQGSFTFDKINGYGKYVWENGNHYIGEFVDGSKEGTGFWKDNYTHDEYQGEYHNNRRNGKGEYRWRNGNIYNGEFKNDLREGFGKMIWATGEIYEGGWKDGLQNGVGTLYMLNGNDHVFVRESQFVNGIEMEKGENFQFLPEIIERKRQQNFSTKSKKLSNLSSSRRKSLPFENDLRKYRNSSSLPKINQKTAMKFRKQSHLHSKTESNEVIEQNMPKKVPKLASIIQKQIKKSSLDYTETQKLPYHRSISKPHSKTEKIDRNRISSYFSGSVSKEKKKTFCVDVSVEDELTKQLQFEESKEKQIRLEMAQMNDVMGLSKEYRKVNDILADSLMIPIKWRNIKRKSHNFILQRKEKMNSRDESFS